MTEGKKLDIYKFDIDVTDDDVNQCREVFVVIQYLAGYCCFAVFKKMKYNSCKNVIMKRSCRRNSYFLGINRGSLLYPNTATVLNDYAVISVKILFLSLFSKLKEINHAENLECFGR